MRVGHSRWDIGAAASLAKAICAAVAVLIVPTVASAGAPPIHLELQWARPADPAGVVDRPWRNGIASGECAEFSRDGRYIATCSKGDGRMGKFHHGGGNSHSVNSVDLISDDRYLLSAGTNTDGGLWRIDTTRDPDGLITSVNLIRLATMTHPTSTTREIRLQPAAPLDTALVALTSEHDQATFVYRMGELLSHRLGAAAAGLALLAAAMRSVEPRPSSGTGEAM